MTISHLAGAPITVEGRYRRQLCQWCGYRVEDVDLANVAVHCPDGDVRDPFPSWEIGAWIRIDGPCRSVVEPETNDAGEPRMPGDSCMRDVSPLLTVVESPDGGV